MKYYLSYFSLILLFLQSFTTIAQVQDNIQSELVILNVKTGEQKTVLKEERHFEAPNWSRDGEYLLINAKGFLEKIALNARTLVGYFQNLLIE